MEPRLSGSMTGGLLRKLDGDWSVKPFTFNGSKFNVRSLDNIAPAQSVRDCR